MFCKAHRSYLLILTCLILLVSSPLLGSHSSVATIVWTENFTDGNTDDWTLIGEFDSSNDWLQATGDGWNWARHSSAIAYGNWTCDVFAADTPENHSYVYLIATNQNNYRISVWTDEFEIPGWSEGPSISLIKTYQGSNENLGSYSPPGGVSGWVHLEVTRNESGYFAIYFNGALGFSVVDNDITSSSFFQFGSMSGPAIDNIVVSDLSEPSPPAPLAIPGFPCFAIILALPLALLVILTIRRKN
jgi:hypothetical protein